MLEGKVVIITGGASGQGEAHVRRCVTEGAKVVFGDIQEQKGATLAKELGSCVRFFVHDVSSEVGWGNIVQLALDSFGRIDALVNNAGIYRQRPLEEESVEGLRNLHDINVVGPFLGMKAVLPHLKKVNGGSVVNISSLSGLRGMPGLTAYGSSKWALRGMTKIWARELGRERIRVNAILPGAIDKTSMFNFVESQETHADAMAQISLGRPGCPADISGAVVYLISDDSLYVTGLDLVIDGGLGI